jgi:Zn-dependent peptidase ImmA (M78 family)
MVRSSCKSGVLQHPINISHVIILRILQKIKMRTRSGNQSEKIQKKKKKKKKKKKNLKQWPAVGPDPSRPWVWLDPRWQWV